MRAVAFAFLLAATAAAGAGEGFKARGFILPDGAVKIDEDRYRLPQPWDEAVRFYRRAYPPGKFPRPRNCWQLPIQGWMTTSIPSICAGMNVVA